MGHSAASPTLVLLKPGVGAPPVFVAPGIEGKVAELSQLGALLRWRHPVYGFDTSKAFEKIDDMAMYYLEAARELQPHGPYLLVGYSFGGLVMLELTRRLVELGERVALLVLVDSYPHPRFWPLKIRMQILVRSAIRHLLKLMKMSPREAVPYVLQRFENILIYLGIRGPRFSTHELAIGSGSDLSEQQIPHSRNIAWSRYSPRRYQGKIMFFRAETITHFPTDPTSVWSDFASELEVHTVPGDHVGIITTHCGSLAAEISHCLASAHGS